MKSERSNRKITAIMMVVILAISVFIALAPAVSIATIWTTHPTDSGADLTTLPVAQPTVTRFIILDTEPPVVTNPSANPATIYANEMDTSRLNVTVTDNVAVDMVTVDLTSIGGSIEVMAAIAEGIYSTETTAAVGTPPGTYHLKVNAADIDGDYNDTVDIIFNVETPKPTISIYTDKTSYTTGNTMHVGLNVTNPGDAQPVRFAIWLEQPGGGIYVLTYTSVTLPAELDYSNPDFAVLTLPSIPTGTYTWNAALIEPSGPIVFISHNTAEWEFGSAVAGAAPTEDITGVLEQTTVVIDFGE